MFWSKKLSCFEIRDLNIVNIFLYNIDICLGVDNTLADKKRNMYSLGYSVLKWILFDTCGKKYDSSIRIKKNFNEIF